jgi:hypothetical protein
LALLLALLLTILVLRRQQHAPVDLVVQSEPGLNQAPTLADLWAGRANFVLEVADTGLPMGESETIAHIEGDFWSYVHASQRSAGIIDGCGEPVEFPGCVVIYQSGDQGVSFAPPVSSACQMACRQCPCDSSVDHIDQQQYPAVAVHESGMLLVYEYRGRVMLRRSRDGLEWSQPEPVGYSGVWYERLRGCQPEERVNEHPITPREIDCLAGAPPGIHVDGEMVYVFVGLGQNPGSMGCFRGRVSDYAGRYQPCEANPFFTGAADYGPLNASGEAANPFFDFRTISSAEVQQVGDRYYMLYEGIRGPEPGSGGDSQFGLGLARSQPGVIDAPWETHAGNPILADLPGNIGLGHADLLVLEGVTYLYTSLDGERRSRLRLVWND